MTDITSTTSDLSLFNRAVNTTNRAYVKIDKAAKAITSDIPKPHMYELDSSVVSESLNLENTIKSAEVDLKTYKILDAELSTYNTKNQDILNIAKEAQKLAYSAMNMQQNPSSGAKLDVKEEAKYLLTKLQEALNSSYNGMQLFSGDKDQVKSVSDLVNVINVIGDQINTNYYQGGVDKQKIFINGESFTYGSTAADNGVKYLIATLSTLRDSQISPGNISKGMVDKAIEFSSTALSGVGDMLQKSGSVQAVLKSTIEKTELLLDDSNKLYTQLVGNNLIKSTELYSEFMSLSYQLTICQNLSAKLLNPEMHLFYYI